MSEFEFIEGLGISKAAILENIQGGNSDVLKYQDVNGNFRSLKIYKGSYARIVQMYHREIAALEFLHKNRFSAIPQDLQVFDKPKAISYQWIDGASPESDEIALKSIFEIINKLLALSKNGLQFDNAIDAAFSTLEIQAQIKERVRNLDSSLFVYSKQIYDKLDQYGEKFPTATLFEYKTLSLSDIGIHNIIRNSDKDYFIDFEFFGLDSVNKMVGDFILHPKNNFDQNNTRRFIENISNKFEWDSTELMKILPLLTLKWALIAFARTFKEENSKDIVKIHNGSINKSIGTQYLKYFDLAGHIGTKNSFQSFCSFQGIMDQL
jgi:hypothetical protein